MKNIEAMKKLSMCVEEFRKLDSDIPASTISAFCHIVCHHRDPQGVSIRDVAEALGVSQASGSRQVMMLSGVNRHRGKGFGLVDTKGDPMYRARKVITLTPKG